MLGVWLSTVVLSGSIILLLSRVVPMARQWSRGQASQVAWIDGLRSLPSRYLHDVHNVVAREPASARMHAALVGGTLSALLAFMLMLATSSSGWAIVLIQFAVLIASYGLLLEQRRRANPPSRLSKGTYQELPRLFASVLAFVLLMSWGQLLDDSMLGNFISALAAICGAYGLGRLCWLAGNGPMRHAFAGVTHLITHPRPDRFAKGRSIDLKPLDLERAQLGIDTAVQFSWPQLASFDSCVQCGRCEAACPAYAAGQPLNPKKFINDLAISLRGPKAIQYAGNGYPGQPLIATTASQAAIVSAGRQVAIAPQTLWSCTTCRACVEECPMMIEHIDAMVDLRRNEVLHKGQLPIHAQHVIENLVSTGTQCGLPFFERMEWTVDLQLPVIAEKGYADVLLWLGESSFDRRAQRTLRALIRLMKKAGVDFAVLGQEERDTGDQARRLGDEATFQALAKANIETLAQYSFGCIVTADPHVMNVLRNEYPAFGGRYLVRHHSDLLAELLATGNLMPQRSLATTVTYHDPCYLGRYNGEIEAPRQILTTLGVGLVEMERSGKRSHCCGGGGGAPLADIPGEQRIPDMRMQQAVQTGAHCIAVACPGCTSMFEGVTARKIEVRDLAELVWDAVEDRP